MSLLQEVLNACLTALSWTRFFYRFWQLHRSLLLQIQCIKNKDVSSVLKFFCHCVWVWAGKFQKAPTKKTDDFFSSKVSRFPILCARTRLRFSIFVWTRVPNPHILNQSRFYSLEFIEIMFIYSRASRFCVGVDKKDVLPQHKIKNGEICCPTFKYFIWLIGKENWKIKSRVTVSCC